MNSAGLHPFNLMNTQTPAQQTSLQPTTSTTLTGISSTNPCLSDLTQLNPPAAATTTPSFYNNFNFAPHFENYWPTSAGPAMMNGISAAAQMYYPLGMYPYTANCPTYPTTAMYQPTVASQCFKIPDPLASTTTNPPLNNENSQYSAFGVNTNTAPTDLKYPTKYEPPNTDYQSL